MKCIHELFEIQAKKSPEALAVVFGNEQITYRELNYRANQLAHFLRHLGVGPDVLVGICLERSLEMVIGLLGILKAGGAYVPLDPEYPTGRLSFMLDDTQTSVLLTQTRLLRKLPNRKVDVICLDSQWAEIAQQSQKTPVCNLTSEHLAYVIYTSGSTGKPKGVAIPHRGVVRLVKQSDYAKLDSDEVFLQFASISFDASTFEIWGCLLNGGRLVVVPSSVPSLQELGQVLQRYQVTTLWLTAGLFHQIVDEQLDSLRQIRQLLVGGDVLSIAHVKKALQSLETCQLLNCYGPTENTTFTCCYKVTELSQIERSVPIGRPIANTQVYVLDEHLQPIPSGKPGELYISGDGLARGYLNRPDLTAERFIPNPYSQKPGDRLYKTGDLVRYLPDGNLEFLCRVDYQVKIRGFRVELGEIETVLGQYSSVRQAIVLARADQPGDKRLVAYVVPEQTSSPTPVDLRRFLKERLPAYMVPSVFVTVATLPLTANGKIDRQALPPPDQTRPELETPFLAPRDRVEIQLTQIWEELFGIRPLGLRDNFFDLGGHSLLAVRLFSQIHQRLGRNLPLATLLQRPTIEQLASIIRESPQQTTWSSLVVLQPKGVRPPFFCVHGLGGGIFSFSELARYLGTDQPFYGLRGKGRDGELEVFTRIEDMAAYYIEALLTIQSEGPYFLGGYSAGGAIAFEMAQQLQAKGEKVAILALLDADAPHSDFYKIEWSPSFVFNFFQNLLHWLSFAEQQDTERRSALIQLTVRQISKRIGSMFRQISSSQLPQNATGVLLDMSDQYSQNRLRFMAAHYQALMTYLPQVYPGRVTLFRARVQPLLCSHDPSGGWGKLAAGGVDVRVVPGSHLNLLKEPFVQRLAEQLRTCLDEAVGDN